MPAIKAGDFVFIYRNHYLFMQRYEIVLIRREDEMEFISINIKKIIAEQNQCLSCYCLFVPFNIIEVNFFFLFLYRREFILTYRAEWTLEVFWKIFKSCTCWDSCLWHSYCWVVCPTTNVAYIFLHNVSFLLFILIILFL